MDLHPKKKSYFSSQKDRFIHKCIDTLMSMRGKRNRDTDDDKGGDDGGDKPTDPYENFNGPKNLALPQSITDPTLKNTRTSMIDTNRRAYQLVHDDKFLLPPACKNVPIWETEGSEAWWKASQVATLEKSSLELAMGMVAAVAGQTVAALLANFVSWRRGPFALFYDYYRFKSIHPISGHWHVDAEFARQKLQGVLPIYIKKVSQKNPLPKKFPVTDQGIVANQVKRWPAGMTIDKMVKANRLYWVDYEWNDSILRDDASRASTARNMCAPMELLFLDDKKELQPLCVQLGQNPSQYPIIWCGGADFRDDRWRVAKLLCNSSEGSLHEVSNHLLMTHFSSEVMYVNLKRNLAPTHPIHELVGNHFWYTLFVNRTARERMIKDEESAVPRVMCMGLQGLQLMMAKGWKEYTMETYDLEKGFADREVGDKDELPNYWYRDDARKVQGSIRNYVSKVLKEFYKSDKDVVADYELQSFVKDLVDPFICNIRGSPFTRGKAETLEQVITFCTWVIWACTGYHAALNNGQYDYFGFPLQAPGWLNIRPLDVQPDRVFTLSEIAKAMPVQKEFLFQIGFIAVLSLPTQQPLGGFIRHPQYMKGSEVGQGHLEEWREELNAISQDIAHRNDQLKYPYRYLAPTQISNSIDT